MKKLLVIVVVLTALANTFELHAGVFSDERNQSPYFKIAGVSEGTAEFVLDGTDVDAIVSGTIVDVTVKQQYRNTGDVTLEAVYLFPSSSQSAVYAMTMTVNDRVIEASIKEKNQARADYEQAKSEGKSAALLEQDRPNLFQMNLGNVLPGDVVSVELKYTEILLPDSGIYEFVFPSVVGPRYGDGAGRGASNTTMVNAPLNINVELIAGLPIENIESSSHRLSIAKRYADRAEVAVGEQIGEQRDFILSYQLAGSEVAEGLLLFEGEEENFFMLMLQPPKRFETDVRLPREFIFVVDVSGSMGGLPIETSKELMENLLTSLQPADRFTVIQFAGGSAMLSETLLEASTVNIERALDFVENAMSGGGTEVLPALRRALAIPQTPGIARSVIVATDGLVRVEKEALDLIRQNLDQASLFPFGIQPGGGGNEYIIEGMAHAGNSEPLFIRASDDASLQARKFQKYIANPVLTQVELNLDGFDAYDLSVESIPDVLAERPVVITGKWRGPLGGSITLRGHTALGPYSKTLMVNQYRPDPANDALAQLWAREKIRLLGDYQKVAPDSALAEEITALGIQYSLLTDYTSFVAVDSLVRSDGSVTPVASPEQVTVLGSRIGQGFSLGSVSLPMLKLVDLPRTMVVGDKTFTLTDGVWIDDLVEPAAEVVEILRGEAMFNKLITEFPEYAQLLNHRKVVIIRLAGQVYRVSSELMEELTFSAGADHTIGERE